MEKHDGLDKRFNVVSKSSRFNKTIRLEREIPTLTNVGHSFTQETRYFESLKPSMVFFEKYDLIGED